MKNAVNQVSIYLSYLAVFNLYTAVLSVMYMPMPCGESLTPSRDRRFGEPPTSVPVDDDESFKEVETDISLEVIEESK